jgi:hypothetical protein
MDVLNTWLPGLMLEQAETALDMSKIVHRC